MRIYFANSLKVSKHITGTSYFYLFPVLAYVTTKKARGFYFGWLCFLMYIDKLK